MSKSGTIVIVEDDIDDKFFLESIIRELNIPNEIRWFDNTDDALAFLAFTVSPIFIIFSDINIPGKNGLEFKRQIDGDFKLRKKSIPFIFYSTSAYQRDVNEAYLHMTIQGFFKKGTEYDQTKKMIKTIFEYWQLCQHPNTF